MAKNSAAVAPASKSQFEVPSVEITRFVMADVATWGVWLMTRLQDRWSHVNDRTIVGFLRGVIEGSDWLFIKSANAVLAAGIDHAMLTAAPIAVEVFALCKNPDDPAHVDELSALYRHLGHWAKGVGAYEVIVEQFTDAPRDAIRAAMGRLFIRETPFIKIGDPS